MPNNADFNSASGSESVLENNFHSRKLDGGTKSEFGRLISQFQEFTKLSSEQSRQRGTVCCSIKRSTTCSKMLLLVRLHCQWSVLRRPSVTCADVCGIETAYQSGFCVLLHLFKGVTGFTLCLTAVIERCALLVVSMSIFPPCRESLRGNGPELKRNFVMFHLGTGQRQKPS